MGAHHRGLDETSTFALRVCGQCEHDMTRVQVRSCGSRLGRLSIRGRAQTCDYASDEPAELLALRPYGLFGVGSNRPGVLTSALADWTE